MLASQDSLAGSPAAGGRRLGVLLTRHRIIAGKISVNGGAGAMAGFCREAGGELNSHYQLGNPTDRCRGPRWPGIWCTASDRCHPPGAKANGPLLTHRDVWWFRWRAHSQRRGPAACRAVDLTFLSLAGQPDPDGATACGARDACWSWRTLRVVKAGDVVSQWSE